MISAATIARVLGGEVRGRDTVLAPGPGHSRKDRSLAIKIDSSAPDGFLTYSHAGDDWRECRDYVRRILGVPHWAPGDEQRRTVHSSRVEKWDLAVGSAESDERRMFGDDDLARIEFARSLFEESCDPRQTLAETFLRDHRNLKLCDELAGRVLRFHPRCPWRDENTGRMTFVPALIAAFRSIDTNEITAVHRIALGAEGSKVGRRMLGLVHRAAIKLDGQPANELHIGEGVETCMAARQLGFRPVWACGSVGAISFFPLLVGVRVLTIFGEAGEVSARAIQICGHRWRKAGRRVRVVTSTIGSDLNDALLQERTS